MNAFFDERNTPNANMADRSVVARNELHESEASEALTIVPHLVLLRRRSGVYVLSFALHKRFCVRKYNQNWAKSSTV